MPVKLSEPLAWRTTTNVDEIALLDQLQAHIVKAHVREAFTAIFVRFGDGPGELPADQLAAARAFLTGLVSGPAPLVKSAHQHLREVDAHHAGTGEGTPYVGVGLTAPGYARVAPAADAPDDAAFVRGMRTDETRDKLADPPAADLEPGWRGRADIDAVILVGAADRPGMLTSRAAVLAAPDSATVVVEERGQGLHNDAGEGIEHFGYVDGRSRPLFLVEDIADERRTHDGVTVWDPSFALDRVLVPEPGVPDSENRFGSYFVFRKLEQNVRRFKQAEEDLAADLGLVGDDAERAGAMLIGRFEDGTPLTAFSADGASGPVPNDFDYDSDELGTKCPFFAHIRKSNPRGSGNAEDVDAERRHIMARRGQTYGVRDDDTDDGSLPPSARPTAGVGLLFMAFNVDIPEQFEFTQATWVDNPGFPFTPPPAAQFTPLVPPPGLDPVIGQGHRPDMPARAVWGGGTGDRAQDVGLVPPTPQAVTLKGGEYFFMPSRTFLASLT